MSKFIAFPVGTGDAFYYERANKKILVDGGQSLTATTGYMATIANTSRLDIVVCTHNDNDHANGIIGLLENWPGTVKEVWLPGSWTKRMVTLLKDPYSFFTELLKDCLSHDAEPFDLELLSATLDSRSVERDADETTTDIGSLLYEPHRFPTREMQRMLADLCGPFPDYFRMRDHIGNERHRLLVEAVDAAFRIRKIIELACHRGCKIRFFKFSTCVSGGKKGVLEPVNSAEMVSRGSVNMSALTYLALTVANKESLVFLAPETKEEPAVLFAADSDLNFALPSKAPSRSLIITAPHHGSEENQNAYVAVADWLKSGSCAATWVRSDCKSSKRPGASFKSQKTRHCTLCNSETDPKQIVELHALNTCWQPTTETRGCSCT